MSCKVSLTLSLPTHIVAGVDETFGKGMTVTATVYELGSMMRVIVK